MSARFDVGSSKDELAGKSAALLRPGWDLLQLRRKGRGTIKRCNAPAYITASYRPENSEAI
jgi:hypothetical protein